jgi:site-specific DNA-adenine methylase
MKAPFPWFGGKSRVAHIVWDRFGDVPNYVEPFAGSLAVLLKRPHVPAIETVNDRDCYIANFWRALQSDPEAVSFHADQPVNEADQHARHLWLIQQTDWSERMKTDPDYYDPKIAGWWVWGQSIWIGSGWCSGILHRKRPQLGSRTGVHRNLPHLGDSGKGVHRQRPHLGDSGTGVHRNSNVDDSSVLDYMRGLSSRLRRVRVCCGDWSRVCGPSPTVKLGTTGVFLDPPYAAEADRQESLYSTDDLSVAHDVRDWAVENGNNPDLRIALCGYEGEHDMPNNWECVSWKAPGGYGSQGEGRGRDNSARERIWFSPHCLKPQQNLFYDQQSDEWMRCLGAQDEIKEELLG